MGGGRLTRGKLLGVAGAAVALLGSTAAIVLGRSSEEPSPPTVYAAASLREAFPEIDAAPRYSFAGSNQLQAQIQRGAPADVFASASPEEAQALFRAGRCTEPETFATNELVLIVPAADASGIRSVRSLAHGDRLRIAVGVAGVPIGDYTRRVLGRLRLRGILSRHTVSQETSVANIAAKVALGSADAGFVYRTDATAAGDRVRAIDIPAPAQPPVRYQVCAVRRPGAATTAARAFIRRVSGQRGRRVLRRWDFGLPPRG